MRFVIEPQDRPLFRQAIARWGIMSQIAKTIEEVGEFLFVLSQYQQRTGEWPQLAASLADEIADVDIMLHQLVDGLVIEEQTDKRVQYKLERLALLLAHDGGLKVDAPLDKAPAK